MIFILFSRWVVKKIKIKTFFAPSPFTHFVRKLPTPPPKGAPLWSRARQQGGLGSSPPPLRGGGWGWGRKFACLHEQLQCNHFSRLSKNDFGKQVKNNFDFIF